jgi:hypothetical protein
MALGDFWDRSVPNVQIGVQDYFLDRVFAVSHGRWSFPAFYFFRYFSVMVKADSPKLSYSFTLAS